MIKKSTQFRPILVYIFHRVLKSTYLSTCQCERLFSVKVIKPCAASQQQPHNKDSTIQVVEVWAGAKTIYLLVQLNAGGD